MIANITLTGLHLDLDNKTKKYVKKKIGALDRYLPRHARKSATAEVKLSQVNRDHGNKYEAEIIIRLPEKTVTAKDTTMNILAAVDIVEAKVVAQLKRYKDLHTNHRGNHGMLAKFKRSFRREANR